jgi:hypothetical protein
VEGRRGAIGREFMDKFITPAPSISVVMDPVPAEKLLRVEHISGTFAVGTGDVVDRIRAIDVFGQEAYLPIHVASRELNFGGALGRARDHQFGSPVRMYMRPPARSQFAVMLTSPVCLLFQ